MRASVSGLIVLAGLGPAVAVAQKADPAPGFPSKPIRFIVPYPAGGPADAVARMVAAQLGAAWNQTVVIDNRGGGGGLIAGEMAARAVPDGHTILMSAIQTHAINPVLYPKLPYHPLRDFVNVTPLSFDPLLLSIHPGVAATTLKEFIAVAKSQPGKINYASTGNGGSSQLSMELLKTMAGVNLLHVPYKGAAPAIAEMLAGQTQATFLGISGTLPLVRAGRLRGLGVSSAKRSSVAPEIPAIAETFPGFEVTTWYGASVPAGTPPGVVAKISAEMARAVRAPEVRDRLAAGGAEAVHMEPAVFTRFIETELAKWGKVVKDAAIRID
jgi:tripartite-type tricarboxylate transporter receptor subunit TctC